MEESPDVLQNCTDICLLLCMQSLGFMKQTMCIFMRWVSIHRVIHTSTLLEKRIFPGNEVYIKPITTLSTDTRRIGINVRFLTS